MSSAKSRCYRKRKTGDSDEEDGEGSSESAVATSSHAADDEQSEFKVPPSDIRELQKYRKRKAGLSAEELLHGESTLKPEVPSGGDPLKLKTGGLIDLRMLNRVTWKDESIEDNLKRAFSKESHLRDEDEEMRKFVEEQLAKKKGINVDDGKSVQQGKTYQSLEDMLYELPEHLKKYQSSKNEEMLSEQLLCGIPEVDLGIDAKIKNIEETEAAKLKLFREAMDKRKSKKELKTDTTFRQNFDKDLAQGYVQHNRFKIDVVTDLGVEMKIRERPQTEPQPVVADDTPKWARIEKKSGKIYETPHSQRLLKEDQN